MTKALFLDRDGVINKDINYLYRKEDFEFIDGVFDLARAFATAGFEIFVITNQAGIARGYYAESDFHKLTEWMVEQFKRRDVAIRKVYFCPYHKTAGIGGYKRESFYRKPNPGMILQARDEFDLDLPASCLVGDKESDIEAGLNAGVGTNVLFAPERPGVATKADMVIHSLRSLPELLDLK